jgi:hypothetical protein
MVWKTLLGFVIPEIGANFAGRWNADGTTGNRLCRRR